MANAKNEKGGGSVNQNHNARLWSSFYVFDLFKILGSFGLRGLVCMQLRHSGRAVEGIKSFTSLFDLVKPKGSRYLRSIYPECRRVPA